MLEKRVILAGIWVVVMLLYLLGDVLRIFAGDFTAGYNSSGEPLSQTTMLFIAVLMALPILMIFASLVGTPPFVRWSNIVIAIVFILLNLVGLPSFPGWYDRYLLVLSMVFNGVTIWYALNWDQFIISS